MDNFVQIVTKIAFSVVVVWLPSECLIFLFCFDKVLRRRRRGCVTTRKPHQYWCVCDYEGTLKQFNNTFRTRAKSQINALKILPELQTLRLVCTNFHNGATCSRLPLRQRFVWCWSCCKLISLFACPHSCCQCSCIFCGTSPQRAANIFMCFLAFTVSCPSGEEPHCLLLGLCIQTKCLGERKVSWL